MRAVAKIDLNALTHNMQVLKSRAPKAQIALMVKSNAYGHGLDLIAEHQSLKPNYWGVICQSELLMIRQYDSQTPVLLMAGYLDLDLSSTLNTQNVEYVIYQTQQIDALAQMRFKQPLNVWLKLETGMHRFGLPIDQLSAVYDRMKKLPMIGEINFMSHLACADQKHINSVEAQQAAFHAATQGYPGKRSLANSAASYWRATTHLDVIRPGLAHYGISPYGDTMGYDLGLQPVMHLTTRVLDIKSLSKGDRVGYGACWLATKPSKIALLSFGYGDGYAQHPTANACVYLNGKTALIVGAVSMDSMAVDISHLTGTRIGDEVELWGPNLLLETVAQNLSLSPYRLLCGLSSRVMRQLRGPLCILDVAD